MKLLSSFFFSFLILTCSFNLITAQVAEVSTTIKSTKAIVLEFEAPYTEMMVDIDADDHTEPARILIQESTALLAGKKKEIKPEQIFKGMEVKISGEKFSDKIQSTHIQVLTKMGEWKVKVEGIFEKYENGIAFIDGYKVKMDEGIMLKGNDNWKNKEFTSFDQLPLGCDVSLSGVRGHDRIIHVTKGSVSENQATKAEAKFKKAFAGAFIKDDKMSGAKVEEIMNKFPHLSVNQLSNGQIKVGEQAFNLVRDYQVVSYVNRVGQSLVPSYMKNRSVKDDDYINFRFYVVEDPTLNAFAYPDGSVFINMGLLSMLENEAQLAAVLGHEVAHVTHEHGVKSYQRTAAMGTVTEIGGKAMRALGNFTGKNISIFGVADITPEFILNIGINAYSSNYGRGQENQADRVGMSYMEEAGYDVREAPKVWGLMMEVTDQHNDGELKRTLIEGGVDIATGTLNNAANGQEVKKALINNVAAVGLNIIAQKGLEMLYSSHPRSRKRYKNLNRMIATNVNESDFDQMKVNLEAYQKVFSNR